MKKLLYPRLAWQSMRKNGRLYKPYILTCIGMVAVFFILFSLSESEVIASMPRGSGAAMEVMGLGSWVLGIFSLIFLFYTNSFLIRRRNREFGLYNVLGMGKRNIARILLWENLIIAALSLAAGLFLGIALSKLSELGLLKLINADATLGFSVSLHSVAVTAALFAVIFALQYISSLFKISISKPVELLRSENAGEKPPKGNVLLGVLGIALLGGAYYLSVSIEQPLTALSLFFVAVIMVIVGSYLVFISGSVLLCRLLQKNKRYYYNKRHFVSVSGMAYRMKRNGAGLASICILVTMVLVMISSTSCLYFGADDSLNTLYPRDVNLSFLFDEKTSSVGDEEIANIRRSIDEICADAGMSNPISIRTASASGLLRDGNITTDPTNVDNLDLTVDYDDVVNVEFIPLSDYNEATGENRKLSSGEALVYGMRIDYDFDTLSIDGSRPLRVVDTLDDFPQYGGQNVTYVVPTVFVVIPDFLDYCTEALTDINDADGKLYVRWYYSFDTELSGDEEDVLFEKLLDGLPLDLSSAVNIDYDCISFNIASRDSNRQDFFEAFGSLLFLGIMLSLVFTLAAVLIIYYKQICEGYEDRRRYEIMQSVGMTKQEIRKSINSQLLTVFFLPLLFAGLHLSFAFPFIHKILLMFNFNNLGLLIGVTALSFVLFALLYTVVYRMTGNAYYKIVSEKDDRN